MSLSTRITKNLSRREQAERIKKLIKQRKKKGLQAWVRKEACEKQRKSIEEASCKK